MRIFLTGGSGFVGGHIIEALSPEHTVLALARSDRSAAKVEALGATPVHGSLEDITPEMLAGVDVIVHSAAYVEEYGPHERYWSINVDGTQRLLDAARAAGIPRFVHISTNATVFDRLGQLGVDETAPYPAHNGFAYGASKAEAERRVLAANADGFTTLSLRPCFVWGPRDNSVLPGVKRMADDGSFVWLDKGRAQVSTTHVHNLVHAVRLALTAPSEQGGNAFFIADDDDVTIHEFISGLAGAIDIELTERSLPGSLVRGVAWTLETTWSLVGAKSLPPVTKMAATLMSRDMTVRTDRARAGLGWSPVVSRSEGLQTVSMA